MQLNISEKAQLSPFHFSRKVSISIFKMHFYWVEVTHFLNLLWLKKIPVNKDLEKHMFLSFNWRPRKFRSTMTPQGKKIRLSLCIHMFICSLTFCPFPSFPPRISPFLLKELSCTHGFLTPYKEYPFPLCWHSNLDGIGAPSLRHMIIHVLEESYRAKPLWLEAK